jgi:hypothetical protein
MKDQALAGTASEEQECGLPEMAEPCRGHCVRFKQLSEPSHKMLRSYEEEMRCFQRTYPLFMLFAWSSA